MMNFFVLFREKIEISVRTEQFETNIRIKQLQMFARSSSQSICRFFVLEKRNSNHTFLYVPLTGHITI